MGKPYKQFFHGKHIPKTNMQSKPSRWIPNTFLDTYSSDTGRFRSRRKYGSDGYMKKDMDVADSHRPYDHVHDYNMSGRILRKPNTKEQREMNKAKRKRRFLK